MTGDIQNHTASSHGVAAILDFWFSEAVQSHWFNATPEFDARLRDTYEETWEAARQGQLKDWEATPEGALALVIVLDQFPLNMFRGRAESFSTEALARQVAERAIARDFDKSLSAQQKFMLYLPYMHSESLDDQARSVALFEAAGLTDSLKWARHHHDIVRRFGRFPHRNAILGRTSRPEEVSWLDSKEAFHG